MKTTKMGGGGNTCLYIFVLVNFHLVIAKPFFGLLFCDILCDDDDYDGSVSTTTTLEDAIEQYFDMCTDCPTTRPRTPRPVTTPGPNMMNGMPFMPPFGFMPPPGWNFTMAGPNGQWSYRPWGGMPGAATPNPAASAPATVTAAPPTTAAPAGTTAAPGGTTAAPGATTKAPATTAAAG